MYIKNSIVILIILLLFLSSNSSAKIDVIYVSHKYLMGDNDSKNDARKLCFIETKRKLIEKTGVFIESETIVKNFQITKDEIRTYSAALLKIEVVKEEIQFVGESIALVMVIKAEVDSDKMINDLIKIQKDKSLKEKIKNQQTQIEQLEQKIKNLQDQLGFTSSDKVINLRKERNVIFQEIDKLEKIKFEITSKTQSAIEKIVAGMTIKDVIEVVGEPRARSECLGKEFLNYGEIWVWFVDGTVKGYIPINDWKGACGIYWSYKKFKK